MCIPSLTAAAFSPTSRWGGWVAVGGGGWGADVAGGGGKAAIATVPPTTKISVTHTETGKNRHGKQNRMVFWT
jgi:hypothetical protein